MADGKAYYVMEMTPRTNADVKVSSFSRKGNTLSLLD
jgi:hypothetical protein